MAFRSPGYDRHAEPSSRQEAHPRTEKPKAQGKTVEQIDMENLKRQPQVGALPELRRDAAGLPSPADVRTREILGIPIAMTDYEQAMDVMDGMVARRERGYVCAVAVHAVTVAYRDPEMMRALRGATLTVPDGMPVVWAANTLGENLPQRVYGPELMRRYSQRCAAQGHRVWLYGGRDQGHLVQLALRLRQRHEGIKIVGGYAPPFRELTAEEEDAVVEQINRSKPDVLWVGIGVPKQEKWMARMRERLDVPVMCAVGAAFDFHAGRISQAPSWMQDRGLEWTYRIAQEPRRLLPRYLYYNPRFMLAFARQMARERRR